MLKLHTYITDYRHTNYITKNIIGKKTLTITSYTIFLPVPTMENSKTQTKPDQGTHKYTYTSPPKGATFTNIGKQTTFITKILKHTNIKIAYHTNNTIQETLTTKIHNHEKCSATGVYKLTCPDCSKAYTG